MIESVRVYIERAKAALNVETDEELAKRIGYSKQAIASWRSRKKIPQKAGIVLSRLLGPEFSIDDDSKWVREYSERRIIQLSIGLFWREFWLHFDTCYPDGLDNLHRALQYVSSDIDQMSEDLTTIIRSEQFLWKNDAYVLQAIQPLLKKDETQKMIRSIVEDLKARASNKIFD